MFLDNEIQTGQRIESLKRRERTSYDPKISAQGKEAFQRVFDENLSEPQVIRLAECLAAFLREKDILLHQDDLLAGHEQPYDYSMPAVAATRSVSPEEESLIERFTTGYRAGLYGGGIGGHAIAGYDRVLEKGFGYLAEAARMKLEKNGDQDFARASLAVCEAATDYIMRYSTRAQEVLQETHV